MSSLPMHGAHLAPGITHYPDDHLCYQIAHSLKKVQGTLQCCLMVQGRAALTQRRMGAGEPREGPRRKGDGQGLTG